MPCRAPSPEPRLFCIGFDSGLFYQLRPLEQRLAVCLSKKFISQSSHRRFVDALATASDRSGVTGRRSQGVAEDCPRAPGSGVPILAGFNLQKSAVSGSWVAVFERKNRPSQDYLIPARAAEELAPIVRLLVQDMMDDEVWWTQCAKRLGEQPI